MIPVIAIVGRPNVGKSTLFNCLTQSRDALVADLPGLTRDRHYGQGKLGAHNYIVIDTGGMGEINHPIEVLMVEQAQQAVDEADGILFVVDGRAGLTAADQEIAKQLRRANKKTWLVINKAEGLEHGTAASEFYQLGFEHVAVIAAAHGQGVETLIQQVLAPLSKGDAVESAIPEGVRVAIIGRPNVGKSTLVNRLLGEQRVLVYDMPGTTRDSIHIPFTRKDKHYTLIDTAGIRRKARVWEAVEKFSIIKTLQAIESAHVIIAIIDAQEGVIEQDLNLLGYVIDAGKGLIIAVNKWDGLTASEREQVQTELQRRLVFIDYAQPYFISALKGTGINQLFKAVDEVYASAMKKMSTPALTRILIKATQQHQPPLVQGRRVKLRYAHQGGSNPPCIVIHGKQTQHLPNAYRRYLVGVFRKILNIWGTPIRLEFKTDANPYAHKRKKVTFKRSSNQNRNRR